MPRADAPVGRRHPGDAPPGLRRRTPLDAAAVTARPHAPVRKRFARLRGGALRRRRRIRAACPRPGCGGPAAGGAARPARREPDARGTDGGRRTDVRGRRSPKPEPESVRRAGPVRRDARARRPRATRRRRGRLASGCCASSRTRRGHGARCRSPAPLQADRLQSARDERAEPGPELGGGGAVSRHLAATQEQHRDVVAVERVELGLGPHVPLFDERGPSPRPRAPPPRA